MFLYLSTVLVVARLADITGEESGRGTVERETRKRRRFSQRLKPHLMQTIVGLGK